MYLLALFLASAPAPIVARAESETVLREGWKVQSSEKVSAKGEEISKTGFETGGWYPTTVPATVFATLVENGVYKDPYFGMNLRSFPGVQYKIGGQFANEEMPEDSPYAVPWWYRKEFEVSPADKGKQIWLEFRGINYRGNIWINGKQVADSNQVVGAFRRYEFNVTDFVRVGEKNVVAVEVSAPKANELGITWVDWNPTPPDKDMGLWQEVVLRTSGPVSLRHSVVETKLDGSGAAHLAVRTELRNASKSQVKGFLVGTILGEGAPIEFSQEVQLEAGEMKEIPFTSDSTPSLNVPKPKLWWPYQMGEPYLHRLSFAFVLSDKSVSDKQTTSFGMVQTTSEMTPDGYFLLKVNDKPVLVRGGGWAPDMMLRVSESRREAEFRYVREMGLNTIRLEGKLEDEAFFERADREGILVMAGWCCCDAWEKWGKWGDENKQVSISSLRDQLLRLRAHASVLVWLNGSDNPPPAEREQAYLDIENEVHWPKPVLSSATAKKAEVSGDSGVKMSGPYDYVPADYWLLDTKAGGAYGFNTETSPGPAPPTVEELRTMFPPDKLWPRNDFWHFHSGGSQFKTIDLFADALDKRYGGAKSAEDFAWKSQAMTYEGERAMFEAYGRNKYKSTGIIQWMLNNAWPSLIWHLYDYNLEPAGGYFGSKKALEPVHAQFSYDDRTIAVVNGKQEPQNGLKLVAKIYDLAMVEKFSREASVDVAADGVARLFAVPEPADISSTYFVTLELFAANRTLLSRNFYWLSTKPDVLNFAKTEWYYTPQTDFADFSSLQTLPRTTIQAEMKGSVEKGDDVRFRAIVTNTGKTLAFLVRLRIVGSREKKQILPVFWDDNYLCLLPGEKREVTVSLRKRELGGERLSLEVDGFNVAAVTAHVERRP